MKSKRILALAVALAACCLATAATAQSIGYLDSSAFDYKYEMNVDPVDATQIDLDSNTWSDFIGWQTPAIVAGTTPTDGSYLELTPQEGTTKGDAIASDLFAFGTEGTTGTGTIGDGIWQNSGITDELGYTVEMSVKIGEPFDETMLGSGSLTASVLNGPGAWVSYGQDGLYWGGQVTSPQIDATSNADDAYHTIRIIKEPELNKFWVYRDGVCVTETALFGGGEPRGMLTAGCMSGVTIGTSNVDYIRFMSGAYVEEGAELPPEPPARPEGTTLFLDTFDTTANPAGINDELGSPRQSGSAVPAEGIGYTSRDDMGLSIADNEMLCEVTTPAYQTAWLDNSFTDLAGGKYGVSAKMNFADGQNASSWDAIILNEAKNSDVVAGYDLIFLARESGWWRVYADGSEIAGDDGLTLIGASEYDVYMSIDESGETDTYSIWVGDNQLVKDGTFTVDAGATGDRYFGLQYYGYSAGTVSMFDDLTIESLDDTPVRTPGDANEDGYVDVTDLGILATNYGAGSGFAWGDGDFTDDGIVDVSDLGILATNYGTVPPAQAVPEPSMLVSLLALALAGFITRGRRRNR